MVSMCERCMTSFRFATCSHLSSGECRGLRGDLVVAVAAARTGRARWDWRQHRHRLKSSFMVGSGVASPALFTFKPSKSV